MNGMKINQMMKYFQFLPRYPCVGVSKPTFITTKTTNSNISRYFNIRNNNIHHHNDGVALDFYFFSCV